MKGLSLWCSNTNNIIKLGNTLNEIRRNLKKHFIDVINCGEEEYDKCKVDNVNFILNNEYNNSQNIIDDFIQLELGFIDDEILDYTSIMKIYKKAYKNIF
jgi:DNA-directed RNA polymerase alpha subunit